jgi:uncharacterized protein YggE
MLRVSLALSSLLVTATAVAQTPPVRPVVRVMGEATISVKPDMAELELAVVTQAPAAATAAKDNAARTDRVLRAIRAQLGAGTELRTTGYAVMPQYREREGGRGAPALDSHIVRNTVRVDIRDLGKVGPVLDAALAAGANEVQRLSFTVAKEGEAQAEALRAAAASARVQATALAAALGLDLLRLVTAEETSNSPRPMLEMARADMKTANTPIEPGQIEVPGQVTLTYEVQPRAAR